MEKEETYTYRVKLKRPTPEQEKILLHYCWVSMKAKNWYIRKLLDKIKENKLEITVPWEEIRDPYSPTTFAGEFRKEKKENPELKWAFEVNSDVLNNAIRFCYTTNWKDRFRKGLYDAARFVKTHNTDYYCYPEKEKKVPEFPLTDFYHVKGFPNFKKWGERRKSFCISGARVKEGYLVIPGYNAYKKYNIPKGEKLLIGFWSKDTPLENSFVNNHNTYTEIVFDGKDWWASLSVLPETLPKKEREPYLGSKYSVGIDKGIKTTLVFSDGIVVNSPYWTDPVLDELFKKDTILTRKMSKNCCNNRVGDAIKLENPTNKRGDNEKKRRLYEVYKSRHDKNFKGYTEDEKLKFSSRYKNLKKKQDRVRVQIERRKKWLIENAIAQIPFERYDRIVVEKFSISSWFKNHKWASKLQRTGAGTLMAAIKAKAADLKIEWVEVVQDTHMASTKTCSSCGNKQDMPLSARVYRCLVCGMVMDRDLNAAINLSNYIPPVQEDTESKSKKKAVDKNKKS